ncbi:MAG TPA: glycosyltransferase family 4 protein [Polyangiaceae bacterium]|nr:glycosyltransferase family 4 protein [Polyangiaceae bacterium]
MERSSCAFRGEQPIVASLARNNMENQPLSPATTLRRLAVVGNHLPRRCGIATFTTDLSRSIAEAAPGLQSFVVAMNDADREHAYPPVVRFEIAEDDLAAYRRCAQALNTSGAELVSLQHEYGIFGGKCGSHVLTLLRELRMPVVTTLHTILTSPSPLQRTTLDAIIELSDRVVVMSEHGASTLRDLHGVDASRIDVIPHGIPLAAEGTRGKAQLGLADQKVILTFGLLSPDKGVEYVIEALPAILQQHPKTVFVVLGATHPHVKERHGEAYRLDLLSRVRRLHLEASVVFHDRFVEDDELAEFLAAADIYVTPYLNPQQSTSGTLARAVAAGRAVISTPYWHARELLTDGRGLLVPVRDSAAIASAANDLLGNDEARAELGRRARDHARASEWPVVARSYLQSFERALEGQRRRQSPPASWPLARPADLPELNLEHLQAMTDDTGLIQHATFDVPRYQEGYCLDDNARALLLMTLLEETSGVRAKQSRSFSARYLAFVSFAFNQDTQRFRNFMSYARHWLEDVGSEDSHARALWALGTVAGRSGEPSRQGLARQLFQHALPALPSFTSPRAWAHTLLGINEYLRAFPEDASAQAQRQELVAKLCALYKRHATPDWQWFEDSLSYDNARLSQALIVSGEALGSEEASSIGLRSLAWLAITQSSADGHFAPIGSNGFHSKGGVKAQFDQQPLEAAAMVSASLDALRATGDPRWARYGRAAFDWFLGQNHLGTPLYDAATGGCRDGLHSDRPNENQGAESTLSFLMALLEVRGADATGGPGALT